MATTITAKGSTASRLRSGNHSRSISAYSSAFWAMARPTAPTAATQNEVNRASSAAPKAGTMNSVKLNGVRLVVGATRTPTNPASTAASIHDRAAWRSADMPIRVA